jgi:hypothetical protein
LHVRACFNQHCAQHISISVYVQLDLWWLLTLDQICHALGMHVLRSCTSNVATLNVALANGWRTIHTTFKLLCQLKSRVCLLFWRVLQPCSVALYEHAYCQPLSVWWLLSLHTPLRRLTDCLSHCSSLSWLSLEGQMQSTAAAASSQWVFQTPVDVSLSLSLFLSLSLSL